MGMFDDVLYHEHWWQTKSLENTMAKFKVEPDGKLYQEYDKHVSIFDDEHPKPEEVPWLFTFRDYQRTLSRWIELRPITGGMRIYRSTEEYAWIDRYLIWDLNEGFSDLQFDEVDMQGQTSLLYTVRNAEDLVQLQRDHEAWMEENYEEWAAEKREEFYQTIAEHEQRKADRENQDG